MKKLQVKKGGKWVDPTKHEATGVLKELLDDFKKKVEENSKPIDPDIQEVINDKWFETL